MVADDREGLLAFLRSDNRGLQRAAGQVHHPDDLSGAGGTLYAIPVILHNILAQHTQCGAAPKIISTAARNTYRHRHRLQLTQVAPMLRGRRNVINT